MKSTEKLAGIPAVRQKFVWVAITVLLVALALSACGGGGDEVRSGAGGASQDVKMGEAESKPDVPSSGVAANETVATDGVSESGIASQEFDRKIVKTAELGIRAEDVRGNAARAQQVAARFGGGVLSSRIDRGDGSVSADLVLTVPSPEFEKALDELRGLGKEVTMDTVSGEDVTEEFVDLESRERNLLAAERSLLNLYEKADSVDDALAIQSELTNVRGEIEQTQGRIEYLEQRTATSQISLSIQPVAGPAPSRPAWDPAGAVARAWNASLYVLQTIASASISVLVFGWWLLPVIIAGLVWWRRRSRGSRPAAAG